MELLKLALNTGIGYNNLIEKEPFMKNKTSTPLMGTVKYKEGLDFHKVLNDSLNVFLAGIM